MTLIYSEATSEHFKLAKKKINHNNYFENNGVNSKFRRAETIYFKFLRFLPSVLKCKKN